MERGESDTKRGGKGGRATRIERERRLCVCERDVLGCGLIWRSFAFEI